MDGPVASPVLRSDGRITTTGSVNGDVALARYRADGRPDLSFGVRGVVVTDLGGDGRGNVLRIQRDGRLVVGGTTGTDGNTSFTIVRYLP